MQCSSGMVLLHDESTKTTQKVSSTTVRAQNSRHVDKRASPLSGLSTTANILFWDGKQPRRNQKLPPLSGHSMKNQGTPRFRFGAGIAQIHAYVRSLVFTSIRLRTASGTPSAGSSTPRRHLPELRKHSSKRDRCHKQIARNARGAPPEGGQLSSAARARTKSSPKRLSLVQQQQQNKARQASTVHPGRDGIGPPRRIEQELFQGDAEDPSPPLSPASPGPAAHHERPRIPPATLRPCSRRHDTGVPRR